MMPDLPNVGLERDIEQFIVRNCVKHFCMILKTFHCFVFLTSSFSSRNFLKVRHSELMV